MDPLSDEQVFAAIAAGDASHLTLLVERYQEGLTRYLDRLVGPDWALAQDLAQETFLRVLRSAASRGMKPFKPWLFAIATNVVRTHFASARVRHETTPLTEADAAALPAPDLSPEMHALLGEQRTAMMAVLGTLSLEHRSTILLRFYAGLSLQEIAEALDIPVGTVKSRLTVGLRRLRAAWPSDDVIAEKGAVHDASPT